jgi:PhnB protein
MRLEPYLLFNGQCEEAFKFYQNCLGGKLDVMLYEGSPAEQHVAADLKKKVLHACLGVDGGAVMGSDCPPDQYQKPQGISVTIQLTDPADGEKKFQALAEGGKILMPFQQTFWAKRYGHLQDRFGISWMVNCG